MCMFKPVVKICKDAPQPICCDKTVSHKVFQQETVIRQDKSDKLETGYAATPDHPQDCKHLTLCKLSMHLVKAQKVKATVGASGIH